MTPQRAAFRDLVRGAAGPLSPTEIHRAMAGARKRTRVGLATVYRTIKRGLAEGWLRAVELPGEPARYEPSDREHHHHFECRRCQKVYDVPGCAGKLSSLLPVGFVLEQHEIVLWGLCKACAG